MNEWLIEDSGRYDDPWGAGSIVIHGGKEDFAKMIARCAAGWYPGEEGRFELYNVNAQERIEFEEGP